MKLVRERQISYDFTHMRTLRDKTDEHREGKQKEYKSREGDKQKRLLNMENKTEGCWRGGGRGDGLNG